MDQTTDEIKAALISGAKAQDDDDALLPALLGRPDWPSDVTMNEQVQVGDIVTCRNFPSLCKVLSTRYQTDFKNGLDVPALVCEPMGWKLANGTPPRFYLHKSSVKVARLVPGDEVFYRPPMAFKTYDQSQDWPRGKLLEVRRDGIHVIESWSWRLATGKGALIYARWCDVRRAYSRVKGQMLPEQRVWRCREYKEAAQQLFKEGQEEDKAEKEWATFSRPQVQEEDINGLEKEVGDMKPDKAQAKQKGEKRLKDLKKVLALQKKNFTADNLALLFLEPAAATPRAVDLVRSRLESAAIKVTREGSLDSTCMQDHKLIDAHYHAIAFKASIPKVHGLYLVPPQQNEFSAKFNLTWSEALATGSVFNADDAQTFLCVDADGLGDLWQSAVAEGNVISLGNNIHIARIPAPAPTPTPSEGDLEEKAVEEKAPEEDEKKAPEEDEKKAPEETREVFVINGFYPALRAKFYRPGATVHYFVAEWSPKALSWAAFSSEVVGAGNPKEAAEGSLRRQLYDQWSDLGLSAKPDPVSTGLHGSGGAFQGVVECSHWLGAAETNGSKDKTKAMLESYSKKFISGPLTKAIFEAWHKNPPVAFAAKRLAVFEHLEGLDMFACYLKARAMAANSKRKFSEARAKYISAVDVVEEAHQNDRLFALEDHRNQRKPTGNGIRAGVTELRVTCYNAIVVCTKMMLDRLPKDGAESSVRSRKEFVKDMIQFSRKGAKEIDQFRHRNEKDKQVLRELRKRNITEAKFMSFWHTRALMNEATAMFEHNKEAEEASLVLKGAHHIKKYKKEREKLIDQLVAKAAKLEKRLAQLTAKEGSGQVERDLRAVEAQLASERRVEEDDQADLEGPLKKQVEQQNREFTSLSAKIKSVKEKKQKKEQGVWSKAVETMAKDPEPVKVTKSPPLLEQLGSPPAPTSPALNLGPTMSIPGVTDIISSAAKGHQQSEALKENSGWMAAAAIGVAAVAAGAFLYLRSKKR